MQSDQENYLHLIQITMCEQKQTKTFEFVKSEENRKGDEAIYHQYGLVSLVTNLTTDAIVSNLSFHQCILIIVGKHHSCGYPSSLSKPFYTQGNV